MGEDRAALIEAGRIVEAAIGRHDERLRLGAVLAARLTATLIPRRRGLVALDGGGEAWLEPMPPALSDGMALAVEIVREPIPEPGRPKRARVRATDAPPAPGPDLRARIAATGLPVRTLLPHMPDALEAAGWSELLDEAESGEIAFPGGALRLWPTPAMALFDVDGALPPDQLAIAGARAAAAAVRRMGIGGAIGIDLPTLASKAERQAAAAAVDAVLPQPFERTAVNGFGFLQIVRRRDRPSLPELLRADPALAAALALLRRAERTPGIGTRTLVAAPAVAALVAARPDWREALARRLGAPVVLRAAPGLAISAGHVDPEHPPHR